jgi:hypothetical protein
MIMIFKIFLRKKLAKKKAVFAQTNASFCWNSIITLDFEENANFCQPLAKIVKIVIVATTPRVYVMIKNFYYFQWKKNNFLQQCYDIFVRLSGSNFNKNANILPNFSAKIYFDPKHWPLSAWGLGNLFLKCILSLCRWDTYVCTDSSERSCF